MGVIKKKSHYKVYSFILIALLVVSIFAMTAPPIQALAAEGSITTILGPGLSNPEQINITQEQLHGEDALPSKLQEVYVDEALLDLNGAIDGLAEIEESKNSVTLEIEPAEAEVGNEITLSGNADPNTFVAIKVVDSKGNIVYFDAVKSDSNEKYNTTFIVPDVEEGELTIVAGYGTNVAVKILKVIGIEPETYTLTLEANPTDGGTVTGAGGYEEGAEVEITAEANEGYKFINWTIDGGEASTDANFTYIMPANDVTLVANFEFKEGTTPGPIEDGDIVLTITGDGVAKTKTYTQSQLEETPQIQRVYSCVNTWPSKQWYVGKGVALSYLLGPKQADIKSNATLIRFTSRDGYYMTLTVEELLEDHRYRFPNFKTGNDGDGHIPGSTNGKVEVETILALTSAESDNTSYMNELDALHLMTGQRAVTEQTGPLFVKNVNKIEVLTESISKWDAPKAEPGSGTVPAGTEVRLNNKNMDQDKIHYTIDGSTPTLDSPIYNWVAKRWWSVRGDETVEKINHPIKITEDTIIKAVTIGPGKKNSDVITFTYKVTDAKPAEPDTSDKIKPSEGGTVSLGSDVVMEIPAGALTGTGDSEVKIERVKEPPTAPVGFKLLSDIYEIRVDGKKSYNFAKKVEIKFSFDPNALGYGQMPAVHYYDEAQKSWVNIGGKVSGSTISVEVDHLTKYGVLVSLSASATARIRPSEGGKLNLWEEAIIEIPAGALTGTSDLEVKIERVKEPPTAPAGFKFLSDVFEFSIDGKQSYDFAKKVKIKLGFDPKALDQVETPAIYYYDVVQSRWEEIESIISDSTITVEIDHLTKFAIMASLKSEELQFSDIIGHWAQDDIKKLVALGAISGYPDNSFKPNNNITRAEFTTILIKTFELSPQNGKVFADTADHWARDMISTAAHHGIVNGYDDKTFGPNEPITREQMVAMIIRVAEPAPEAGKLSFVDNDRISDWARNPMVTAVKNGIINGYPDNTVRPRGLATRAEAVTVIVRAPDKREK